jgi:tRNA pseudouridine38-40 synthase
MNNYKLTIQYDGGRYKGWQRLGKGENTIQEKIEKVLREMTGEELEIHGCSRTDAGVHALFQIASFKLREYIEPEEIKTYLNRYLPDDISIIKAESCNGDFHARYSAKSKTYLYKIWNNKRPNPFLRKYSLHVEDELDIFQMKKGAQYFIGKHDFTAFTNAKSKKKSMVREIYSISIEKKDELILIRIRGNGFLHNMVRKIVGTLIRVGMGQILPKDVPQIIKSKDRSQADLIASADGLFLESIEY